MRTVPAVEAAVRLERVRGREYSSEEASPSSTGVILGRLCSSYTCLSLAVDALEAPFLGLRRREEAPDAVLSAPAFEALSPPAAVVASAACFEEPLREAGWEDLEDFEVAGCEEAAEVPARWASAAEAADAPVLC